jgi:hypothetical protein
MFVNSRHIAASHRPANLSIPKDEARSIATNIAKLSKLPSRRAGAVI